MSGHYVAFEGIEGAGKSTAIERVAARLSDVGEVVVVREPGGTDAGERVRSLLLDAPHQLAPWTEAMLFAASRAQLAAEVIGPAQERGAWVLSDRSVYSSLAYQGGGRRLGTEAVRAVNEVGLGGVWPEMVVLLRIDAAEGLGRQDGADRIGSEALDFHRRVAAAFDSLAEREAERFVVVDAEQSLDVIVELIYQNLVTRWVHT